jgi:hypothetical protein
MAAKTAIDTESLLKDAERLIPLMEALSLKLGNGLLPSFDDDLLKDFRSLVPVVKTSASLASCSGGEEAKEITANFTKALQPLQALAARIGSGPFEAFATWLSELWADEFNGEPGAAFDGWCGLSEFEDAASIAGDVV